MRAPSARALALPVLAGLAVLGLLAVGLVWALRAGGPDQPVAAPPLAAGPLAGPSTPGHPLRRASAAPAPDGSPPTTTGPARTGAPAATAGPATDGPPTDATATDGARTDGTATNGPAAHWAAVLDALDVRRAQAFAQGDAALLATVYTPGSAAAGADGTLLAGLLAQGETAQGVRHHVRAVDPVAVSADSARLRVTDVLDPQEVERGGAAVEQRDGRGDRAYEVLLERDPASPVGWRIASMSRA